jgi:hypothetical protein
MDSQSLTDTQEKIRQVAESIGSLVVEKNRRYGDSALSPLNLFSRFVVPGNSACCDENERLKHRAFNQILTRLDDKLKRIQNADTLRKNDVADVMGYLLLLCVQRGWIDFSDLVD